jgi:superfamily I DNA and RNA helicase
VDQGAAVIETVQGVQRIRGLAGSGKTIVLALKVAYLHAQNPDWKIAVTFNTRSLKGQFERLITNFVFEQTSEEPDWQGIEIINAWGAPGTTDRTGIYFKFCQTNDTQYYDYRSARSRFGEDREFQGACKEALAAVPSSKQLYDAILIDEAQDFPPEFLKLCYEFLREPKRLVYAYDELQSLTNASMPPPEEIFGKKAQYPNCRIPLSAPLSPARFATFILRNFYHKTFYASELRRLNCSFVYPDTITANERAVTHLIG